ncbi:hypothetical protein ICM05_09840 [Leucobacter sp. cx-42]|uniref:hypothetical protein n=1 Tax=unclassified Leucobacter TaxID=2621730 RepID=UPI00165E22A6|nr:MULTISPECIES: hypothetical protein [unclassified Leucobacter]MBC9954938.1 hypothetical protein [Leucobacter sp. cx-42]
MGMKINRFRLRYSTEGEQGGSGQPGEKKSTADMTPEERIEFETSAKRSAQDKLKAFNGVTPADVAEMQRKLEEAETEKLTEQDRKVKEARDQTRAEVRAEGAAEAVELALKIALRGRTADAHALLDLDRSSFVVDGKADASAIGKWVDENSSSASDQKRKPPVNLGQGSREPLHQSDRATGEAEAQKRFGKK